MSRRRSPGLDACVATHSPSSDWRVELEIETTSLEIADVIAVAGDKTMSDCLVEATWAVELTWNFNDERKAHRLVMP